MFRDFPVARSTRAARTCTWQPPPASRCSTAYMDAPLSATGNLSQAVSLQSGAVVYPASQMRLLRPRARMVYADRIQNAYPGSKPCG